MVEKGASFVVPQPPAGFAIERSVAPGRHPILDVFPGLESLPTSAHLQPDASKRTQLFGATQIELTEDDVWMYVAPREIPAHRRGRWNPVLSPDADCIVVGRAHLRESPAITLFMDIFHELRHVLQRQAGAQLFPEGKSYVERPTEIDAYRFVIGEGRALGVSDEFLRDYLRVEWIDEKEFHELLSAVGVSLP
jgi:hypothetical protein